MSLRFLALGDSYTIGEGVAPDEQWPVLLTRELRAMGVDLADPTLVARTGWTTDELSAALAVFARGEAFDLVSLLVGVNDQYRRRGAAEYRRRFADTVRSAVSLSGGRPHRVIVLSIPDWGVTPFGARDRRTPAAISSEIDRFNAVNREEAHRARTHYVDVTGVSRRAALDPSLLTDDELHPSAAMYREWASLVLPYATAALGLDANGGPSAPL